MDGQYPPEKLGSLAIQPAPGPSQCVLLGLKRGVATRLMQGHQIPFQCSPFNVSQLIPCSYYCLEKRRGGCEEVFLESLVHQITGTLIRGVASAHFASLGEGEKGGHSLVALEGSAYPSKQCPDGCRRQEGVFQNILAPGPREVGESSRLCNFRAGFEQL